MYLAIAKGWAGDRLGAIEALDEAEPILERWGTEWTRVLFERLRGLQLASEGDLLGARESQRAAVPRLIELGDPSTAASTIYLAAVLGDMAGCDDVLDDIRVRTRTGDDRQRRLTPRTPAADRSACVATLPAMNAVDKCSPKPPIGWRSWAESGLHPSPSATSACSNWTAATRPSPANTFAEALPSLLQMDRPAAGLAVGALAVIRHRGGDERQTDPLLAAALALRVSEGPVWEEDGRRLKALAQSIGVPVAERAPEPMSDDVLLEIFDIS